MKNEPDLLDLLITHELTLKDLYKSYADIFPACREFWLTISSEEQRHASLLEKLKTAPDFDVWLHRCQFKSQAVASSLNYLKNLIVKANNDDSITLVRALTYSKDIENALIEKLFNKIDYSISSQITSVLDIIAEETSSHRSRISKMLEANR
jgi:hypothetical protein